MTSVLLKLGLIFFLNILFFNFCQAKILSGNIDKEDFLQKSNAVIDEATGAPIPNAEVSIPSSGIFAKTNNYGQFNLDTSLQSSAILSVKALGYKPFAITVDASNFNKPFTLGLTKLNGKETIIDSKIHHLGDDKFSSISANAKDFNFDTEGAYFSKKFFMGNISQNSTAVLKIGSVIGLDTQMAKKLNQSKITLSSSSPTSVYLNFGKIADLKINGDNQEIYIPKNQLLPNSYNVISIKTGVNQQETRYTDYDDMEFMHLILEIK